MVLHERYIAAYHLFTLLEFYPTFSPSRCCFLLSAGLAIFLWPSPPHPA